MPGIAGRLSISYERPESNRYLPIYKALKSNHRSIYGESVKYLNGLYKWHQDTRIIVTTCATVDSRYLPDENTIVICYESLYQKVDDYPEKARSKAAFKNRVYQNVIFTFWHEVGHALMDQFQIGEGQDRRQLELLADEFAALSMLWRNDDSWKQILMISALHFKSKSKIQPDKTYEVHPPDDFRYQKMVALLYGFAQKSYSKLKSEVDQMDWLDISAQEYYLERSAFWEQNLWNHTRRDFFNN